MVGWLRAATALVVAGGAVAAGTGMAAGGATGSGPAVRATAYVAADTSLATQNPDVDVPSNCGRPDMVDIQTLSPSGSVANNVHVDACLFTAAAPAGATASDADGPATFESFGVGGVSACPDPDGAGPRTSTVHDHDGDGRNEHCHLSGYQLRGTAGDLEFHARFNNSTAAGQQRILFCLDPDQDGCLDESVRAQVALGWVPPSGS